MNKTESFDAWLPRWRERLAHEPRDGAERRAAMHAANPLYIPRNHRVEQALSAAAEHEDYAPFEELLAVLAKPYEERPGLKPMPNPRRRIRASIARSAVPERSFDYAPSALRSA